jgi:hypothetical protein
MKPIGIVALTAMSALMATAAAAQLVPTLRCGSAVRIDGTTGWLAGVSADSVVLTTYYGERSALPLAGVTETEALRSRGSHWGRGIGLGVLIGGAAGAIAGAAVTEPGAFGGAGFGALVGLVVGAGGGLVVGAAAGGLSRAERWLTLSNDTLNAYARQQAPCGPHVRVIGGRGDVSTEGALLDVQPDRLVLAPTDGRAALTLSRGSVQRIEQRVGTRGQLLIGAAVGLAAGAIAAKPLANTTKNYTGFVVAGGVALGALVGLAIRSPLWESIRLEDVEVGVAPGQGGARLSAAVRF